MSSLRTRQPLGHRSTTDPLHDRASCPNSNSSPIALSERQTESGPSVFSSRSILPPRRSPSAQTLHGDVPSTSAGMTVRDPSSSPPVSRPPSREVLPRSSSLAASRKRSASGDERRPPLPLTTMPASRTHSSLASRTGKMASSSVRQPARLEAPSAWAAIGHSMPNAAGSVRSSRASVNREHAEAATRLDPMAPASCAESQAGCSWRSLSRSQPSALRGVVPIQIGGRSGRAYPSEDAGTSAIAAADKFVSGSFTRTRMSIGDDDDDQRLQAAGAVEKEENSDEIEEEYADLDSLHAVWTSSGSMMGSTSTRPGSMRREDAPAWGRSKGPGPQPGTATPPPLAPHLLSPVLARSAGRQASVTDSRHPHGDVSIQSHDTDWDEELGITEVRQAAASLLKPLVFSSSSPLLHVHAGKIDLPATAAVIQPSSKQEKRDSGGLTHSPQIRGLRVTQSVSESWDDDFLFQNDDNDGLESDASHAADAAAAAGRTGDASHSTGWVGGSGTSRAPTATAAARHTPVWIGSVEEESEEEENWDAAFSWEDGPQRRPSALRTSVSPRSTSRTASLGTARLVAGSTGLAAASSLALQGLQLTRSVLDGRFARHGSVGLPRNVAHGRGDSTSSRGSNMTDLSAPLAMQSDASSCGAGSSSESLRDDVAPDALSDQSVLEFPGFALAATSAGRPRKVSQCTVIEVGTDDSGDETETEADISLTPVSPVDMARKSKRRSLFASFTRGKDVRGPSAAKHGDDDAQPRARRISDQRSGGALVGIAATLEVAGPRWSKPGTRGSKARFYKMDGPSTSRSSVANVSDVSLSGSRRVRQASHEPLAYEDQPSNSSLTSLNSQCSQRSRRSIGVSVPSKLEKGYRALRNARIGHRAGQKPVTPTYDATRSPPSSPLARSRTLSEDPDTLVMASSDAQGDCSRHTEVSALTLQVDNAPQRSVGKLSSEFGFTDSSRLSAATKPVEASNDGRRSSYKASMHTESQIEAAGQRGARTRGASPTGAAEDSFTFHDAGIQLRSVTESRSPAGSPARARRDHSSTGTLRASAEVGKSTVRGLAGRGNDVDRQVSQPGATRRGAANAELLNQSSQRRGQGLRGSLAGSEEANVAYSFTPPANSRSISASTATSASSSDALSGSHHKDASWSGTDMYDSETTHGTSIGSDSPSGHRYSEAFRSDDSASGKTVPSVGRTIRSRSGSSRAASPPELVRPSAFRSVPSPHGLPRSSLIPPADGTQEGERKTAAVVRETTPVGTATEAITAASRDDASSAGGGAPSLTPSAPLPEASACPTTKEAVKRPKVERRNSLSDLRIPSRISRAQTGIRANISLVRDFAKGVEELKTLQARHVQLRAVFGNADAGSKHLVDELEQQFQNWWDCADVLIGLGQGRSEADAEPDVRTISQSPVGATVAAQVHGARERRITLDGPASRRTSTVSQAPRLDSMPTQRTTTAMTSSSVSAAARPGSRKERHSEGLKSRTSSTSSRHVNPQREIDLIAAMINAASLGPEKAPPPPTIWERAPSVIRDARVAANGSDDVLAPAAASLSRRDGLPDTFDATALQDAMESRPSTSSLSFADASPPPRKVERSAAESVYPYNTAPAAAGSRASLYGAVSTDSIGLVDGNKSAKRRLRSASRAGLQGLKELLKAFRSNGNDEDAQAIDRDDEQPAKSLLPFRKSMDASASIAEKDLVDLAGDGKAVRPPSAKKGSFGWMEVRAEKPSGSPFSRPKTPVGTPVRRRSNLFRRKKDDEPSIDSEQPSSPPPSLDSPLSQRRVSGSSSPMSLVVVVGSGGSNSGETDSRPTANPSRPPTAGSSEAVHRRVSRLFARSEASGAPPLPPLRVSSSHGRRPSGLGEATLKALEQDKDTAHRRGSPTWSTAADAGREESVTLPSRPSTTGARYAKAAAGSNAWSQSQLQRSRIGKGRPSQPATSLLPRSPSLSHSRSPSPTPPGWSMDASPSSPRRIVVTRSTLDSETAASTPLNNALDGMRRGHTSLLAKKTTTAVDSSTSTDSSSTAGGVANASSTASFQKMTLKPEAIPGLLVYLHATKQHCQEALDGLQSAADKLHSNTC